MTSGVDAKKRNTLKLVTAGGAATVLSMSGIGAFPRPAIAQTRKISLQTGTPTAVNHIGEVVASKLGYYREAGLELDINPGGFNNDGISAVAAGASQFGKFSSSPQIMLARASGVPVKCIAAGMQKHPFVFVSRERRPITKASDFVDSRIATQPTSRPLIRAMMHVNNIDPSRVTIENMAFDVNQLIVGQVDAATVWATSVATLEPLGKDVIPLLLWDLGVRLYANVYYVTETVLANEFNMVTDFIRATARGWEYTYKNPEFAVDALIEAHPNLDRQMHMKILPEVLSFVFNEQTKTNGWGNMNPATWQDQLKLYSDIGEFRDSPVPSVDDVMSLSVLEATTDVRSKL